MKICTTTPDRKAPNGGIRLINDFANQLRRRGHETYLLDEAASRALGFTISRDHFIKNDYDLVIVCSPHSQWVYDHANANKRVTWMQMAEHLWSPSQAFEDQCYKWYANDTVILNAQWLKKYVPHGMVCRTWLPDYFDNYPPSPKLFDILLESPFSRNPTKDAQGLAWAAALHLKMKYGAKVIGYGAKATNHMRDFLVRPEDHVLKRLYATSGLLLKATIYDGAACAPIEAAKYGCVTVRALNEGDDWLSNNFGYRCTYDEKEFVALAEKAFLEYKQSYDVDYYGTKVNVIKSFADQWTFENFIKEFSQLINIQL